MGSAGHRRIGIINDVAEHISVLDDVALEKGFGAKDA